MLSAPVLAIVLEPAARPFLSVLVTTLVIGGPTAAVDLGRGDIWKSYLSVEPTYSGPRRIGQLMAGTDDLS